MPNYLCSHPSIPAIHNTHDGHSSEPSQLASRNPFSCSSARPEGELLMDLLVTLQEENRRAREASEALLQQQRLLTAATLRRELREYNNMASQWKPLPLLNGEPFPDERPFPRNIRALKEMSGEELRQLATIYEISFEDNSDQRLRDHLAIFIAKLRA